MLSVHSLFVLNNAPCSISIDEFVPIRFRSYEPPIGALYVRFGDRRVNAMDLILQGDSHVLRGFTLTCFDQVFEMPAINKAPILTGLPVLSPDRLQEEKTLSYSSFEVSMDSESVLIAWDSVRSISHIYKYCDVDFLVANTQLNAMRVNNLSVQQIAILRTHGRHSSLG